MKKFVLKFMSLILIFTILFGSIQAIFIQNNSYASEDTDRTAISSSYTQYVKSGISAFPESYQSLLSYLKYLHPNWEFNAYYTGIPWDEVKSRNAENQCLKNTIYKIDLMDPLVPCTCGQYGDSNYYCASAKTVNYYLDPRNSLSESMVFQFLDLSGGNSVSRNAVVSATSGTYLAQYVDYIMEAASEANVNPLHIVATIFQELGTGSSTPAAISGTYSGYEGYYNFFNWGASDGEGATSRAMAKAKELGWDSPEKALVEGTKVALASNYIDAGQTTKYFYKFDVVGNEILTESMGKKTYSSSYFYSHQYMTNVCDPSSQAGSLYNMYGECGLLDENLVFTIPVYDDMPSSVASYPTSLTSSDGDLYYVSSYQNYSLNMRKEASTSSSSLGMLYRGTIVAVTGSSGDFYKVKVIGSTRSNGEWAKKTYTGYIHKDYLTKVGTTVPDYTDQVDTGSSSNFEAEEDFEIDGDYIYMTPITTTGAIFEKYSSAKIVDENKKSITDSSTLIATGYSITINDKTYTAIKLGDVNGDGTADSLDSTKILKYDVGLTTLTDVYKLAGDLNGDETVDSLDSTKVLKYDVGLVSININ